MFGRRSARWVLGGLILLVLSTVVRAQATVGEMWLGRAPVEAWELLDYRIEYDLRSRSWEAFVYAPDPADPGAEVWDRRRIAKEALPPDLVIEIERRFPTRRSLLRRAKDFAIEKITGTSVEIWHGQVLRPADPTGEGYRRLEAALQDPAVQQAVRESHLAQRELELLQDGDYTPERARRRASLAVVLRPHPPRNHSTYYKTSWGNLAAHADHADTVNPRRSFLVGAVGHLEDPVHRNRPMVVAEANSSQGVNEWSRMIPVLPHEIGHVVEGAAKVFPRPSGTDAIEISGLAWAGGPHYFEMPNPPNLALVEAWAHYYGDYTGTTPQNGWGSWEYDRNFLAEVRSTGSSWDDWEYTGRGRARSLEWMLGTEAVLGGILRDYSAALDDLGGPGRGYRVLYEAIGTHGTRTWSQGDRTRTIDTWEDLRDYLIHEFPEYADELRVAEAKNTLGASMAVDGLSGTQRWFAELEQSLRFQGHPGTGEIRPSATQYREVRAAIEREARRILAAKNAVEPGRRERDIREAKRRRAARRLARHRASLEFLDSRGRSFLELVHRGEVDLAAPDLDLDGRTERVIAMIEERNLHVYIRKKAAASAERLGNVEEAARYREEIQEIHSRMDGFLRRARELGIDRRAWDDGVGLQPGKIGAATGSARATEASGARSVALRVALAAEFNAIARRSGHRLKNGGKPLVALFLITHASVVSANPDLDPLQAVTKSLQAVFSLETAAVLGLDAGTEFGVHQLGAGTQTLVNKMVKEGPKAVHRVLAAAGRTLGRGIASAAIPIATVGVEGLIQGLDALGDAGNHRDALRDVLDLVTEGDPELRARLDAVAREYFERDTVSVLLTGLDPERTDFVMAAVEGLGTLAGLLGGSAAGGPAGGLAGAIGGGMATRQIYQSAKAASYDDADYARRVVALAARLEGSPERVPAGADAAKRGRALATQAKKADEPYTILHDRLATGLALLAGATDEIFAEIDQLGIFLNGRSHYYGERIRLRALAERREVWAGTGAGPETERLYARLPAPYRAWSRRDETWPSRKVHPPLLDEWQSTWEFGADLLRGPTPAEAMDLVIRDVEDAVSEFSIEPAASEPAPTEVLFQSPLRGALHRAWVGYRQIAHALRALEITRKHEVRRLQLLGIQDPAIELPDGFREVLLARNAVILGWTAQYASGQRAALEALGAIGDLGREAIPATEARWRFHLQPLADSLGEELRYPGRAAPDCARGALGQATCF